MNPTFFIDDAARSLRQAEVPFANFANGCNLSGSCAPGVGIGVGTPNLVNSAGQFTLNDQRGDPRTPQTSQSVGGYPYAAPADYPSSGGTSGTLPDGTIRSGAVSPSGDGQILDPQENVSLVDLATGWEAPAVP